MRDGVDVDLTVATQNVKAGEIILSIPENLIVTLDSIFEDGAVAELLTTNKLSELACLTLYLAYEKKRGKDSFWYPFIKELDRQGGRGPQGAKSPLLWPEEQVEDLLAGSPVIGQIKQRLKGIEKEYQELDTVWFMAGSLFKNYPFEIPTEQFSLELFTQAFAAVQSSVVHLQGVPLSKRFALVPLGPPLLTYSSTSKAMLQYDQESRQVRLAVDRSYIPGESVVAWCGPQPNSRLLLNYGVVDENNPYDKMPLVATISSDDPIYRQKRMALAEKSPNLSTQQTFQLTQSVPLPAEILPYLRLAHASTEAEIAAVTFDPALAKPVSPENEARVLGQLAGCLHRRLGAYKTTVEEDDAVIADSTKGPRETVAAKLVKIEKGILKAALSALIATPGSDEAVGCGCTEGYVTLS